MKKGADQTRRKTRAGTSARPSGGSDFPSPSSPFSRRYEGSHRESRRRVSGGTIACELGAGGGDEKEEDVYDFLASRSSRTRSATGAAPVSIAGGGGGGVGGSGKGDTSSPAGGSGARAGDGAGTFSNFAKSLREFQGDLDLRAATTGEAISETAERGPRENEVEAVGGEAWKVLRRGGTEETGDVNVEGRCEGADVRESSGPLRFQGASTNSSTADAVDDGGEGERGERARGFPSGAEASIVGATSPLYLLASVAVSGLVRPTSPGGRSALSLPPAPPDSPPPSPLPSAFVAFAAAGVPAAEDKQSTGGHTAENERRARFQAEAELVEARARQADLTLEVDRLRTVEKSLEARAAQAAAALGVTMKKTVELLDRNLEKIREQEKELDRLRRALSSRKAGGKGAVGRSPSDVRKIKGRVVEELEKELDRIRSSYTRGLKGMEREAENQIRALKRGGSGRGGGGGDSNRLGAEDGRSVHGRDDDNEAARMTRRDEADGQLRQPGGKREHQSSATTTAAAATGGRVGIHGARSSPPPFAGRLGGNGIAASSSAAFGSPSAPAASSPPVRQTASSSGENRRVRFRDPREAVRHRQDVRLVQTAQALGKAQAREQAELWGRGRAKLSVDGCNASADTRGRGEDLAEVEARARERERHQQQQQQQEKARELELKTAIARERQAAAAKDLERSEVEEMERRTARRKAEIQRILSESREHSKRELQRLQALYVEKMRAEAALVRGSRAERDASMMTAGRLMEGGGSGGKAERIATDRPIESAADRTKPAWGMVW